MIPNDKDVDNTIYFCIYCKDTHAVRDFLLDFPICTKGYYLKASKQLTFEQYQDNMKQIGHDVLNLDEHKHVDVEEENNDFGFPSYEDEADKMYVR